MSEKEGALTTEALAEELEHLNAYVDATLARFDEEVHALRRQVDELTQRLGQLDQVAELTQRLVQVEAVLAARPAS